MLPFYYNMIVILMSVFMCMSGVLLTALAYRPKEIAEEWWEWTDRFYKSETWRIAGPVLIILSLMCHVVSVSYCIAKRVRRRKRQEARRREKEESDSCEVRSIDMDPEKLETKCLLENGHDIACFPDSSLRSSRSRIRTVSQNLSQNTGAVTGENEPPTLPTELTDSTT